MIDEFSPEYSLNSFHRRVNLLRADSCFGSYLDGKRLLRALKKTLTDAGWVVTQTYSGRMAMTGMFPLFTNPCSSSTPCPPSLPPPPPCPDDSTAIDFIKNSGYSFYDPLRQSIPTCIGPCGGGHTFIPLGLTPVDTIQNFADAVSGGGFVTADSAGNTWLLWNGIPLDSCDDRLTGFGVQNANFPDDPYYRTVGIAGFAIEGGFDAGWELRSPISTLVVELRYVVDTASGRTMPLALSGGTVKNPAIRVKAADGSGYNFTAILSSNISEYHIYANEHQFAVWADGQVQPNPRPTALYVMAPTPSNQPIAFSFTNLVVTDNMSPDGSSFAGDHPPAGQTRTRLFWSKGMAENFDATYSQTVDIAGNYHALYPSFICRGFDNSRSMLFSNRQPFLENPWLMLPFPGIYQTGGRPSMLVGKVRDSLLMSARFGLSEMVTRYNGRLWHLFCDQLPGPDNVNLSLWFTALYDEDDNPPSHNNTDYYDSVV